VLQQDLHHVVQQAIGIGVPHHPSRGAAEDHTTEEYAADWQSLGDYRGQNSNMHLTEALMAAFEATGERRYLGMAESIAGMIIDRHARAQELAGGRALRRGVAGRPATMPAIRCSGPAHHAGPRARMEPPAGAALGARRPCPRLDVDAAKRLFLKDVDIGWDSGRGFYTRSPGTTVPISRIATGGPVRGMAPPAMLGAVDSDPAFESWYRRIWGFVDNPSSTDASAAGSRNSIPSCAGHRVSSASRTSLPRAASLASFLACRGREYHQGPDRPGSASLLAAPKVGRTAGDVAVAGVAARSGLA